ncbi:hypothetical protein [Kitasatospora griseola]|uniref:hypothetical protein n=1 Tax=Kitasatospora griseola TaxID=2064 RepID=UPI0019A6ED23|nr:hypothetical protein [Kitasatospora griseola]GGR02080.1 hypothetical protein GCM10010195_67320 [Kitasatospora griseola]
MPVSCRSGERPTGRRLAAISRRSADLELLADAHDDTTDLEHVIAERWNELVVLAGRWEDQPGHDDEGWQAVETSRAPYLGPGMDSGPTVLIQLRLGATWTEIAAGFEATTEQVRAALLRHFADTMRAVRAHRQRHPGLPARQVRRRPGPARPR